MKRLILFIALWAVTQSQSQVSTAVPMDSKTGAVPNLVKFSGVAKDLNGKTLTGVLGVTFALYKDEQGGAELWMETQNVHADALGHYNVSLGAEKPLPVELFSSGEARWLGIQVAGQKEQNRILLVSVPYALKAADSEMLGGKPASAFLQAPSQSEIRSGSAAATFPSFVFGSGTAHFVPLWTGKNLLGQSTLFQSGANLGIGTTTPAAALDVNGTGNIRNTLTLFPNGTSPALSVSGTGFSVNNAGQVSFAVGQAFPGSVQLNVANTFTQPQTVSGTTSAVTANASDPNGVGMLGFATSSGAGSGIGVEGVSLTSNGVGIDGFGAIGVVGSSSVPGGFGVKGGSSGGTAVQGQDFGTGTGVLGLSGTGFAVYGQSSGTSGLRTTLATAVRGDSNNFVGVLGSSASNDGVHGDNVAGSSGISGSNYSKGYGVYATAAAGAQDYGVGVRGESFGTGVFPNGYGSDGVQGVTHTTNGAGVSGINDAIDGIGVYGTATSPLGGFGFSTPNNVHQDRGSGGWVKAMVFVDPFTPTGTAFANCFNSQVAFHVIADCGFKITHLGQGVDMIDFGFQVNDRFISATSFGSILTACVLNANNPCAFFPGFPNQPVTPTANQVLVNTQFSDGNAVDRAFWLIVF